MKIIGLTFLAFFITFIVHAGGSVSRDWLFFVSKDQLPKQITAKTAYSFHIAFTGNWCWKKDTTVIKGDSILNLSKFLKLVSCDSDAEVSYRLIYGTHTTIDSIQDWNHSLVLRRSILPAGSTSIIELHYNMKGQLLNSSVYSGDGNSSTSLLAGYATFDLPRNVKKHPAGRVWVLSIGIDHYETMRTKNSKSDAESFVRFFKEQYARRLPAPLLETHFTAFLLQESLATKDSILGALRYIAAHAAHNDFFIFNFSGFSNLIKDKGREQTFFFPYNIVYTGNGQKDYGLKNRNAKDTLSPLTNALSLTELQQEIQLIAATNQLFISEAGPSEKFKAEFIRTLMKNAALASILNKNRIIMVPNQMGMDDTRCGEKRFQKGPINYLLTSLDSSYNVFDIFEPGVKSTAIATALKSQLYQCNLFTSGGQKEYFDVFFEKDFLAQYHEIFGDAQRKRGADEDVPLLQSAAGLAGKKYALVFGTDLYKAKDWDTLYNPSKDAKAVAEVLQSNYGFDVRLEINASMDTVYEALRKYYTTASPDDQLILYFAGHGDFDKLLDDGFIVCADSKPRNLDPMRNTYIQHSKLQKIVNQMPARQVLVMLDICHGGYFDTNVLGRTRESGSENTLNRNVQEFLREKSKLKTRWVLSSVGKEAAFDGAAGEHSPFANLLLQVLKTKGEGTNGIITLSNIYDILQTAGLNSKELLKIAPHKAGFGSNEPFAEFVLIPQESSKK